MRIWELRKDAFREMTVLGFAIVLHVDSWVDLLGSHVLRWGDATGLAC